MTVSAASAWLLAHAGGWDELLIFGGPVLLAILGVRWAEKRARAKQEERAGAVEQQPTDPS